MASGSRSRAGRRARSRRSTRAPSLAPVASRLDRGAQLARQRPQPRGGRAPGQLAARRPVAFEPADRARACRSRAGVERRRGRSAGRRQRGRRPRRARHRRRSAPPGPSPAPIGSPSPVEPLGQRRRARPSRGGSARPRRAARGRPRRSGRGRGRARTASGARRRAGAAACGPAAVPGGRRAARPARGTAPASASRSGRCRPSGQPATASTACPAPPASTSSADVHARPTAARGRWPRTSAAAVAGDARPGSRRAAGQQQAGAEGRARATSAADAEVALGRRARPARW